MLDFIIKVFEYIAYFSISVVIGYWMMVLVAFIDHKTKTNHLTNSIFLFFSMVGYLITFIFGLIFLIIVSPYIIIVLIQGYLESKKEKVKK